MFSHLRANITMRIPLLVQVLLSLLVVGCASSELFLTPRIAPVVTGANLGFRIKHFSARTNRGFLEIEARAARNDEEYRSNFDLELESLAQICAALAKSDVVFNYDWHEIKLTLWNEYGNMLRWRNTFGVVIIKMQRETFQMLREGNVPVSEYPKHWCVLSGSKAGPQSEMLELSPCSSESKPNK
jgi:hypothetical protein